MNLLRYVLMAEPSCPSTALISVVNGQAMRAAGRAAVRLAAVAYRPNVMASGYAQTASG